MSKSEQSGSSRQDRVNKILAEYLEAVETGNAPDRQALLARHPTLAEDLEAFLADHDRMKELGVPKLLVGEGPAGQSRDDACVHTAAPAGARVRYFGDYELLEEVARGGMGVVYKARQMSLNRHVALKMILAGQLASQEDVKRFYTEAEAAASLDHPGIVPIFEVGEHDGQHFFTMGFVEGSNLAAKVADGPLPPREAAAMLKSVAEAVHYAHERGVIHRDLKPANILLEESEEPGVDDPGRQGTSGSSTSGRSGVFALDYRPRITDFGLAKRVEGDGNLTATGQILGTPGYMPPEQAAGKIDEVTETADIYSLGAILYNVLTARPPFQADNSMDTLVQVLEEEPVSPRQLNPKVPRDLETVCLKCLNKDRRRRYASAQELAEELDRFLEGRPILARPAGKLERLWRWSKRRPAGAALIAVSILAMTILLLGGLWYNVRLNSALIRAEEGEGEARRSAYFSNMLLARRDWEAGRAGRLQELLDGYWPRSPQEDLRGWEWYYLQSLRHLELRTLRGHEGPVGSVAWSPDGRFLASGGSDRTIRIWDPAEGKQVRSLRGHAGSVRMVAWSPDGGYLASGADDGTVRVWEVVTGRQRLSVPVQTRQFPAFAWSPDGRQLALAKKYRLVNVVDAVTGREVTSLRTKLDIDALTSLSWSPDGQYLARGDRDRSVTVWNVTSGRREPSESDFQGRVYDVIWGPDSQLLAYGQGSSVVVHGLDVGKTIGGHREHNGAVKSISWSPEGRRLACGSADGMIGVWEANTGKNIVSVRGHTSQVRVIAWSPDGRRIASGGDDGTVRIRDAASGREALDLPAHGPRFVTAVAWSPDGTRLATGGEDSKMRIWDASIGYSLAEKGPDVLADGFRPPMQDTVAAPSESLTDYYKHVEAANQLIASGKLPQAIEELSRAIELYRQTNLLTMRGDLFAGQGHWKEAAADYTNAVELAPSDHFHWQALAVLQLQQDELEAYKEICQQAFKRFSDTHAWTHPMWSQAITVRLCCLAPDSGVDRDELARLADLALSGHDHNAMKLARGMVDYRSARYERAAEQLPESGDLLGRRLSLLFKAMAHHQLGHGEQAGQLLAQGIEEIEQEFPTIEGPPVVDQPRWVVWCMLQIVCREATELIGAPAKSPHF